MAAIISEPHMELGTSPLVNFVWIEDSLAHNLDITAFRINLPKQTAPIAFVTGRTLYLQFACRYHWNVFVVRLPEDRIVEIHLYGGHLWARISSVGAGSLTS